jgi:hypothetical protein
VVSVKIVSGDLNDDADDEIVIVHTTSSIGTVAVPLTSLSEGYIIGLMFYN